MTIRIGAIADDFTGATDLAVLIRRSGMKVTLVVGVPGQPLSGDPDAIVVALKSRNIAPEEAVAQSLAAASWLRDEAGAERLFFKYCSTFDSTDQGNIGPVADALGQFVHAPRTIFVPAFPENGRRMFLGHLFVNGRLLSESSMANHPLTPMHDPDIVRVLSRQRPGPVGLIDKQMIERGAIAVRAAFDASAPGSAMVCDAIDDGDLDVLAEAFSDLPLATGGSAIGGAIARRLMTGRVDLPPEFDWPAVGRVRTLVVSGSGSEMTQRQVENALANGYFGVKVTADEARSPDALVREVLEQLDRAGDRRSIVYATDSAEQVRRTQALLGREEAGRILEEFFGRLAATAAASGYNAFVVAGGETSGAVVKALGAMQMSIGPEIATGVPWVRSGDLWMALKSGNFGDERFFDKAQDMLVAKESPA
ncbi:MAG TPA: 3-oxo-tetronate kinase [Devosiaceae bacterium]